MVTKFDDWVEGADAPNADRPELNRWLNGRSFEDAYAEYEKIGYVVFRDVMPPDEVARVREALTPYLTKAGRNDFEGFKSNRVYGLIAKAPDVFSDMVTHPLALAFAERELGQSCLLSALLAINLHPGETVQPWHCDDAQIQVPRPHAAFGVSTFWAIDDTTETNGATEVIPGSHLWSDADIDRMPKSPDIFDADGRDPSLDPAPWPTAKKITLPAGSLMIAKGTLMHRGGANTSDASRLIVTPQYCPGWARQLENMAMVVPREIATTLPKRTRELIGYNIHAAFMGYVDGMHPDRLLEVGG